MEKITRYSPSLITERDELGFYEAAGVEPCALGEYVLYSDYEELLNKFKSLQLERDYYYDIAEELHGPPT